MKKAFILVIAVLAAAAAAFSVPACERNPIIVHRGDTGADALDDHDAVEVPGPDGADVPGEGDAAADPAAGDPDAAQDALPEAVDAPEENEEPRPPPDPPDELGPYIVGTIDDTFHDTQWGEYAVTVYFPADYEGTDLVPAREDGPFPPVVFVHGYMGNIDSNEWLGWHLASWGYVTALLGVPNSMRFDPQQWADGIMDAIDYLIEKNEAGFALEGMIDEENIGAAGHSMGAMGAILAVSQDERIDACVPMAPAYYTTGGLMEEFFGAIVEACESLEAAVQLQVGTKDRLCPPDGVQAYYDHLPPPREIIIFAGGNHMGFLEAGMEYDTSNLFDNPPDIPREEQVRLAKKYMTSWFHYYLKGWSEYAAFIFGDEVAADLDSGVLSHLEFTE
ncbi:MAG: hypothetical protein ABIJ56_00540 [Pseudomonadota bacterium]